ncbi:MAG TPA: hypothetical protein VFF35_12275 [Bacteroidia bacterium]|nr:hypothetical protein [Bacteroidia bacterium]
MMTLYIKISIVWITTILYAYAQTLVDEDHEVSLCKFTLWLQKVGGLREVFSTGDFSKLLELLESSIDLFCKQRKRKRTTTMKEIENEAAHGNQNVA